MKVGYLPGLTHGFLGAAIERWQRKAPGIAVDYLEMDGARQEKALLEGSIDVGVMLWGERPVLELLRVRSLLEYPVRLALPEGRTVPGVDLIVGKPVSAAALHGALRRVTSPGGPGPVPRAAIIMAI